MNPQPLIETVVEKLDVSIYHSNQEMGKAAALVAAEIIKRAIQENGVANLNVATGNSQITFLDALRGLSGIDWSKVSIFHMDEYNILDCCHWLYNAGHTHH